MANTMVVKVQGVILSGGQKQRIIARAMIDPEILILDDSLYRCGCENRRINHQFSNI